MIMKEIDVSKVKAGMVVKNYSELCSLLGIKPGTNIAGQLKHISKWINVEKVEGTRSYLIKEVYGDNSHILLVRGNGKYLNDIQSILLNDLLCSEGYKKTYTHRQLMLLFGAVNELFYYQSLNILEGFKCIDIKAYRDIGMRVKYINGFKDRVETCISPRINSALKSMEKRGLIYTRDWYAVCRSAGDVSEEVTDQEYHIIRSIEKEIFAEYGFTNWGQVFLNGKTVNEEGEEELIRKKFFKEWNQIFMDSYGWYGVYKTKLVMLNTKYVEDIKKGIEKENCYLCKKSLNKEFIELVRNKTGADLVDEDEKRYKEIREALIDTLLKSNSDGYTKLKQSIKS